ncbi:MAG: ribosome biogenesis GTPase Der [Alphaproteobacteria bacterium]|nr:ribosome biogenesis GTPase Der [Alphaproteobacteria bacterium]
MKKLVIVGRPNTGKSTLFNGLTNSRDALVHDRPGVTRDVISGQIPNKPWVVFDTAGLENTKTDIARNSTNMAIQTIQSADAILFVVDGRTGLNQMDLEWAKKVHQKTKAPVLLLANKTESAKRLADINDFYKLGFGTPVLVSAEHKRGFDEIFDFIDKLSENETVIETDTKQIKIAILGQPNVGKSTFVNHVLGEQRQIVMDEPGITRDTVKIPTHFYGRDIVLMDTAGLRRKAGITDDIETLSALKSLDAIDKANIIILIVDATKNIENQSLSIASKIYDAGKILCVALNKWDLVPQAEREEKLLKLKHQFSNSFHQIVKPLILAISAQTGTGIKNLFKRIYEQWDLSNIDAPTSLINRIVEKLVSDKQPPMSRLKRPMKIKFAHQTGHHPVKITINVGGASDIPESYTRYLSKGLATALKMEHLPFVIEYKKSDNPFEQKDL